MPRIITGTARGMKLETLEGEHTRPTSDMVKEAVFSAIQFDIEGRCVLDLFAGSGQLGIEALSRGAAKAVFIDNNAAAAEIVKQNLKKARLFELSSVLATDAFGYIKGNAGKIKFDIVFIDPPYASGEAFASVKRLYDADMIADFGIVVCETDSDEYPEIEGFDVKKHSKYGKTYITMYVKKEGEDAE